MDSISHNEQKEKWDKEHQAPFALKQMDSQATSSGVMAFIQWLEKSGAKNLVGLEMGCGKGRNVIGLAKQGMIAKMYGFDFSDIAIQEAKKRAKKDIIEHKTQFDVMDATVAWKYPPNFFDFGIDCTASTDIEDSSGREFAVSEMHRVLKPHGYFLVYVMSTDDEYHKMMIEKSPAQEQNAFIHPETGKFEKVFSEEELNSMYKSFKFIEARRVEKKAEFFGKMYNCRHHWRIYQK